MPVSALLIVLFSFVISYNFCLLDLLHIINLTLVYTLTYFSSEWLSSVFNFPLLFEAIFVDQEFVSKLFQS